MVLGTMLKGLSGMLFGSIPTPDCGIPGIGGNELVVFVKIIGSKANGPGGSTNSLHCGLGLQVVKIR